jgi:hypothetical protein
MMEEQLPAGGKIRQLWHEVARTAPISTAEAEPLDRHLPPLHIGLCAKLRGQP